ncbi:tripartite tricarboxylate transporter permease [Planctomycetota bacterium]
MIESILQGFVALLDPQVFLLLVIGFSVGLFFGIVPGLTATLAIALLLPITFALEPIKALVMAMGIFMAGIYSGSVTGIIVNIPGSPGGAVTTMEGYPLMLKGRGTDALTHAAFSSFVGGVGGVLILMFLCPVIARGALLLHTADRFSLIVLSLVAVGVANSGSMAKGIVATTFGLMLGTIGIDTQLPLARYHFGFAFMTEGIDLLPAIIGIFAVSELLYQIEVGLPKFSTIVDVKNLKFKRRDFIPKLGDIKKIGFKLYAKSAVIGNLVGALPGAGAAMAGFISYAEAKRSSKHPEEYGKGTIEGVSAVEAANNSMCAGAMVPLLTLGIPGDACTAMVLGMFKIQGIVPGPALFKTSMHLITPMYAALMVGAVMIPISLWLFGPYYIKISQIRRSVLYSFIALIAMAGAYASAYSPFQMTVTLVLGVVAFLFRKLGYPAVPLLMGIILGPMAEDYLRRALMINDGNPMIFFTRPFSLGFLIVAVIFAYFLGYRQRNKPKTVSAPEG